MTTENTASGGGADELDLLADAKGTTHEETKTETVPDKYKGKSIEDLINMHRHAERKIGEQGQEVSTLRRLTDEVIGLKKPTTQKTEEARKPVTVDALLSDPDKAIRDAVAGSDVTKRLEAAEAKNAKLEASITEERFTSKYKDFNKDIENPDFIAWVNKNPLRQALAAETAARNFQAADNLWGMWDEYKELTTSSKGETKEASRSKPAISTVKAAPSSNNKGKPVYSRAKVLEFKMRVKDGDPAALVKWKDPEFQRKLNEAYADDRVK